MRLELIGNPEITNYQFNSKINKNAVKHSVLLIFELKW